MREQTARLMWFTMLLMLFNKTFQTTWSGMRTAAVFFLGVLRRPATLSTAAVVAVCFVFAKCKSVLAAVDFTNVGVDTADIFTFAAIILAAIGAIWGIKKLIGMGNKS